MHVRTLKAFFLISILITLSSYAQGQNPNNVLPAVIAAHGGAALSNLQTIQLTGQSNRRGKPEKVSIIATSDGRIRFDYGDPVTYSVVRGMRVPFDRNSGKLVPKPPHTDVFAALDFLAPLAMVVYANASPNVTSQGSTQMGTVVAERFQIQTKKQQTFYLRPVSDVVSIDIHPQSGLILAINRQQFAEESLDHPFTLSYVFSDHRSTTGVMLPFQIDKYINGILRETITIDSIALNPSLSSDAFTR